MSHRQLSPKVTMYSYNFCWPAAGVFIVIKCIFKYLAWLYHDKDKPLRDAVRLTSDYLSQHTYFEVTRAALQRLYNRLAAIFQKRIRFFYLFLFFLLLNAASLCLGKYYVSIDPAELKSLTLSLNELLSPDDQLTTIDMIGSATVLYSSTKLRAYSERPDYSASRVLCIPAFAETMKARSDAGELS